MGARVGVTEEYGEVSAGVSAPDARGSRSSVAPISRRYHSAAERAASGKRARKAASRSSHARWELSVGRGDPIELLERQAESRIGGAGSDSARADDAVAFFVLSWRRVADGL